MKKSDMEKNIPEAAPLPRTIVVIGMMGAGKSSIGAAVARLADAPFIDADREIEAAAGCAVAEIFASYGEAEFRRLEKQVIARLLDGAPCVLSLGGGAFMDGETRARIREAAFSVWLKVDEDVLLRRVTRHGGRPLLADGDPAEKMARLIEARTPVYAEADLVVTCDDRPVGENAQRVWDAIQTSPGFRSP
ncbi:MAG: shikimate kinase [Alphaproteobacteria bacterium]|nr:shikimate kinase [Alphaproteobacteria bacterium]